MFRVSIKTEVSGYFVLSMMPVIGQTHAFEMGGGVWRHAGICLYGELDIRV